MKYAPKGCFTLLLAFLSLSSRVAAEPASLDAPAEAVVGSTIAVRWVGPGNQYDSVYVIAPEAGDDASGVNKASITSGKNPVNLLMPEEPGTWELRYWDRNAKSVLARRAISVVDVETTISAPESAAAGAKIAIEWTGPGNSYERIALVPQGAPDDAKSLASATVLGRSPVQMHLPEQAGDFELRYVTRQKGRVLARRSLTIEGVSAEIEAPDQAEIGSEISVSWVGPGNQYDSIALYPAGADDGAASLRSIGIVSKKNPVSLHLPEAPGRYELRYVTMRDKTILARRPLEIVAIAASINAPDETTAAIPIEVGWSGPGNDYDFIGIVPSGAPDDRAPLEKAAILSKKRPLLLPLPAAAGPYELRYLTAQQKRILARKPITLLPAGRLQVVFELSDTAATTAGRGAIEIILDASGSMLKREGGERRIEIARAVLDEMVREHLPDDRDFALRVFGHKEADSCRTDLEIPLAPLDRDGAAALVAKVNAMNLAKTPIADSLARVQQDLAGAQGPRSVILITDGEETCDGDPAAVIRELRAAGLGVQISIVGFAIDDAQLRSEFESWAELGGGNYFDARSADELVTSLRTVISGPFRVLDEEGREVVRGVVGGAEVVLPAGTYRIETVSPRPKVIEKVEVRAEELTRAAF